MNYLVRIAVACLATMGYARAADPTFTSLYSFTGQNGDGATPRAGVVIGAGGELYGTTEGGGTGA